MSHVAAATVDTSGLSDRVVSWLRTVVPSAWGALIVWGLAQVDWPAQVESTIQEQSGLATSIVTALAIGAWYWLWRRAEPHIPAWLVRVVLGSAKTPTYGVTVDA